MLTCSNKSLLTGTRRIRKEPLFPSISIIVMSPEVPDEYKPIGAHGFNMVTVL